MIDHITALYCIVIDLLKAVGYGDDLHYNKYASDDRFHSSSLIQQQLRASTPLYARDQLDDPDAESLTPESQAACCERAVNQLFHQLCAALKEINILTSNLLDSFPVAVCHDVLVENAIA
jgi:hypothetical protein